MYSPERLVTRLAMVYLGMVAALLVIVGVGVRVLPSLIDWMDRLGVIFAEKASHAVGYRLIPADPWHESVAARGTASGGL